MNLSPLWRTKLRPNPFFLIPLLAVGFPLAAQTNTASTPVPAATNSPVVSVPPTNVPTSTPLVDPFSDPLIKQVETRHEKAVNGDTKETKALTVDLEKWTKDHPDDHLLQAYLGSVYTLDSRDAWPGPGKLTYLRNGGKELDAAVAAAPDNPAIRFIRAIDYYELPSIFGKRQTARDDFKILLKQIDGTTPTTYLLNIETQQAICYYAGLSAMRSSQTAEAKSAWLLGYKLGPTTVLGKKIGDELMKVKQLQLR